MNYEPNTTQWKPGDLVIHDADAKEEKYLMRVVRYSRAGLCETAYADPVENREYRRRTRGERLLNRVCVLHDPRRFKIPLPGTHADDVPPGPDLWLPKELCRCCTCGYEWRKGQDGSHSCSTKLAASLKRTRGKLTLIQKIQHDDMPEPWRTRVCNVLANAVDQGPWIPASQDAHDAALIQGALDTLGVALSGHSHQWTEGERAIFEEATTLLSSKLKG